jgi:2-C-methyl-D-erythritol 2,4-cyclodiphosphate synthase
MAANLARALALADGAINIKAGTNEGLGYLGRGEGIAAWATVLAVRIPSGH